MTVSFRAPADDLDPAEPLRLDAAFARAYDAALRDSVPGPVGLELEAHLVDLDSVTDPVGWERVGPIPEALARTVRSPISLEPGGQVELSGPPAAGIAAAVADLRADLLAARASLAEHRLGLLPLGADPLRPSRRVNPRARYQAMEAHFAATGRGAAGAVMMNSTAAIQINLQAGPSTGWAERIAHAHRIGPTMLAISAASPWLHGRSTGWKSARQRAWAGLDQRSCGPVPGCAAAAEADPRSAWARFALRAPVSFVASATALAPVSVPVAFQRWADGSVELDGRLPTAADLDAHLSTLFPPVRLRGYLELRYLDTTPRWAAVAAVVATLMDDPVAADLATEATAPASGLWTAAAQDGLNHPVLAESARRCLCIAAEHVAGELVADVVALAELVEASRCPGDEFAALMARLGAPDAVEELARA